MPKHHATTPGRTTPDARGPITKHYRSRACNSQTPKRRSPCSATSANVLDDLAIQPDPMAASQTPFDVGAFLHSSVVTTTVPRFPVGTTLFAQDDAAETVIYLQHGWMQLSVVSRRRSDA